MDTHVPQGTGQPCTNVTIFVSASLQVLEQHKHKVKKDWALVEELFMLFLRP